MAYKIKKITICSSASFYKQAWDIKDQLENRVFTVLMPHTAKIMNKTKNYNVSKYKTWFKDKKLFVRKAFLMRKHFSEIEKADAILVVNLKKKGISGYIGGNVLMEMGLAFYLKKPIFIWNKLSRSNPLYEEILGTLPIVIYRNLKRIKTGKWN